MNEVNGWTYFNEIIKYRIYDKTYKFISRILTQLIKLEEISKKTQSVKESKQLNSDITGALYPWLIYKYFNSW